MKYKVLIAYTAVRLCVYSTDIFHNKTACARQGNKDVACIGYAV